MDTWFKSQDEGWNELTLEYICIMDTWFKSQDEVGLFKYNVHHIMSS